MTISVLYISYTGLLEPLGQSQVLQYVLGLARDHRMTLLTFEKPDALADRARLRAVEAQCAAAGVDWHRLTYHNRPGIPATAYDLLVGIRAATRLARRANARVVHCRSYLAGIMGLAVKRRVGARYVFDMRGFWPDERVDGGIWRRQGLPYRLFKRVERQLFLQADHVVSLTRAGVREFSAFDYLQGRLPPVSVIPTCTNLALFRPAGSLGPAFILGYIGSVGSWYMFEDIARAVRRLFDRDPGARFLVLNKGGHEAIRRQLATAGVDDARVEIKAVPFERMSEEIARMTAGIFFIKPVWSKRASCPTRMGEFLASGKPCLANRGVGDVEEDLCDSRTGVTIGAFDDATLDAALGQLIDLAAEPDIGARCRAAAEARFALDRGIADYSAIYERLAASPAV
jgi:glycosyltransferase involved in cell wall biosynthesis